MRALGRRVGDAGRRRVDRDRDAIRERRRRGACCELTERFDATERPPTSLRVDPARPQRRCAALEPELREALELAAANIRAVAEAQLGAEPQRGRAARRASGDGPRGRRSAPPASTRPGGRAAYPSSVLMCAIPARVAGVERIALASPPGAGRQAQPAGPRRGGALRGRRDLRDGRGPGDLRARLRHRDDRRGRRHRRPRQRLGAGGQAARSSGTVGIDSLAGPSELMLIAGDDTDPEWAALDLCAQAEHGADSPLVVARGRGARARRGRRARPSAPPPSGPSVADAPLALVQVARARAPRSTSPTPSRPSTSSCFEEDAALLAERVTTAGCVFVGRYGATAFGDYVAGSNHVLPTGGAGRFSGPLGPGRLPPPDLDRRDLAPTAAAKLAPHVDALARAEGFPVHGESAMIRSEP